MTSPGAHTLLAGVFQGDSAGDLWPRRLCWAQLQWSTDILWPSASGFYRLPWCDEVRLPRQEDDKGSKNIVCVHVPFGVCVCVWEQYINTLLYWGASPNLHVFFPAWVNETGIDMQTAQRWWKNNSGLKGVTFITVYCQPLATATHKYQTICSFTDFWPFFCSLLKVLKALLIFRQHFLIFIPLCCSCDYVLFLVLIGLNQLEACLFLLVESCVSADYMNCFLDWDKNS